MQSAGLVLIFSGVAFLTELWSFAGLGFLSLYLSGKIKCFDPRGHVSKLCIFFLPILAACLVGISRVDDYKHHWQDVLAGGLLAGLSHQYYHGFNSHTILSCSPTQRMGVPASQIMHRVKMPEIQLGAHTIRSHGARVARFHMHDWLILMLLVVMEIILNVINPFYRFVGVDMMTDLKYPLKDNTVPFWAVPLIAVVLPLTVIITFYFIRRNVYDLHQATLGLLFSVLITGVLTDAIKDGVGRPRPDFFWRCFPDGVGVFHNITGNIQCTGLKSVIKEGHKSFPSGHTSWSFAGLGFLAWYLSGKIKVFDRRGHIAKLCIIFVPLLLAALVGVSRVDDYWHHWQDVFAGSLLGLTVASFCYLQFFPPPYDVDGWAPHAYFNMLAESQTENRSTSNNANHLSVAPSELESVYIHSHNLEANAPGSNSILEDTETQRRH